MDEWDKEKKARRDMGNLTINSMAMTEQQRERNETRRESHKLNMMRRKRQQQEYKAILVENLEQKGRKADIVKLKRFIAVDYGMEQAKALQQQFFKTTNTTVA